MASRRRQKDIRQRFTSNSTTQETGNGAMTKRARYTFDALLEELGDLEEVSQRSLKKGISEAARARMTERRITKQKLSQRMNTSRAQVDRILDPDDTSITLATLVK